MKGVIQFDLMQEADLEQVAASEAESTVFAWSRELFADTLQSSYSSWVMRRDGELVGQGVLLLVLDEAHLLIISVRPAFRGAGLGKRLLHHLIGVASTAGASRMFLELRVTNEVALSLYRQSGFTEIGRRKGYYPAAGVLREDALVMRREL